MGVFFVGFFLGMFFWRLLDLAFRFAGGWFDASTERYRWERNGRAFGRGHREGRQSSWWT